MSSGDEPGRDTGAAPAEGGREETLYDLPSQIEPPFEAFLNGIPQEEGADFTLRERTLVFPRELRPEPKLSRFRLALAALGIAGTYTKHDTLDIVYTRDGRRLVATGLPPRPTPDT